MNPSDLIKTARGLTELSPRRPAQANLRRAVSTAYYAMFHCLARTAANLLIGSRNRGEAWHQAYRALGHGNAGKICENKQAMRSFAAPIQGFADTFVALQDLRYQADYALDGQYEKLDVLGVIDRAENAITKFEQADKQQLRTFAAQMLFIRRRPFKEVLR